jgi:acyl carrier protein
MQEVEQQLREIVARLGRFAADFDPKAHFFRDLGVESVKALELLLEIEDSFQIALPDEEYNAVQNLDELVALIGKLKS